MGSKNLAPVASCAAADARASSVVAPPMRLSEEASVDSMSFTGRMQVDMYAPKQKPENVKAA